MDELAKKLSGLSFAVIGVICLIGVYQQRTWLEMFTIGGAWQALEVYSVGVLNVFNFNLQCRWRSLPFPKGCR